jgi:hypothetical protein
MKLSVRVFALVLFVAAAVVGNSSSKLSHSANVLVAGIPGGGPIPMCNPFTEKCPNIR